MTTTDDVPPTRVTGPTGLLAAIPAVLGFHPRRSLVLVCLSGPRRRMGPVIRVDLPAARDRAQALTLTRYAQRYADEVAVVAFQETRARRPLLDQLLRALESAEIPVMEVLVVRDGRAWPARDRTTERTHPGIPVPDSDDLQVRRLAAASAIAGRAVLASRGTLARSIAGPTGARLAEAERAIDAAARTAPASGPDAARARRDEAVALADECLTARAATGTVPLGLAASFAVALQDVEVRDAVLARAVLEVHREWPAMLISCASETPDAQAADVCAVLAAAAYRHGDGALAQVAVDRCLSAEPGHRLALLLLASMAEGMHPMDLERLARTVTGEGDETLWGVDEPDGSR